MKRFTQGVHYDKEVVAMVYHSSTFRYQYHRFQRYNSNRTTSGRNPI